MTREPGVLPRPGAQGTSFDDATAVAPRRTEESVFDAVLDGGWAVGAGINGGLVAAVVARALSAELGRSGHRDPLALSAYFLSPCRPGPATVRTETVRAGRGLSTGAAVLSQPGEDGAAVERLRVLASYGDLGALTDEVRTTATPPPMPGPDECVPADQAPATFLDRAPVIRRLDLRLDPATVGWAVGQPSGVGTIRGWFRLPDRREPDPLLLVFAADALPPTPFDLGIFGWVPTVELTVHVRARPVAGWLRVSHTTRNLAGGFLEEDAEIWDEAGRLVAQSRQLARAPGAAHTYTPPA
ncbi:thioesterase family protein [Plantactinospora siamensis]|uniref:Thioesterase family protein n=1 Tax=Plantactinospora siamensis TaxID=555372 RepID=A0ABV6P3N6_9ACTN